MVHRGEYLLLRAVKYLIALGSNLGDRLQNLYAARVSIEARCGLISRASHIYVTAPVGLIAELDFYNQVILLESKLSPFELLRGLLSLEEELGRLRYNQPGYMSRSIDLDILLAEEMVVQTGGLQIPHPRMTKRRFVLVPAVEIAPDWIHPLTKRSLKELLISCKDKEKVALL